jgi:hypothetical protein
MLAATSGRSSFSGSIGAAVTMPAIAAAALPRIRVEIRFSPATSTTLGARIRSVSPTYGAVSPAAAVETISLGTPSGSGRNAVAAREVPPVPPRASAPCSLPSPYNCSTTLAAPRAIA